MPKIERPSRGDGRQQQTQQSKLCGVTVVVTVARRNQRLCRDLLLGADCRDVPVLGTGLMLSPSSSLSRCSPSCLLSTCGQIVNRWMARPISRRASAAWRPLSRSMQGSTRPASPTMLIGDEAALAALRTPPQESTSDEHAAVRRWSERSVRLPGGTGRRTRSCAQQ